jgi:hypothetical protein
MITPMRWLRTLLPAFSPLLSFLVLSAVATAGVALAEETISFGTDGDFQYAYVDPGPDGNDVLSGNYSGQVDDLARDAHQPVLWFERDGQEYVVKGPTYTSRARTALQPVMDLGREQGKLGAKQGELGEQQGKIGERMGELGERLGALSARQAEARMDGRSLDLSREIQSIRHDMLDLKDEQEPLARQQRELGAQQRELGRQQREASHKADAEMRRILDDAIHAGAANRLASDADDGFWTI